MGRATKSIIADGPVGLGRRRARTGRRVADAGHMTGVDGGTHARDTCAHTTRATVVVGAGRPIVAGPAIGARSGRARAVGRVAHADDTGAIQVIA